MSILNQNRQLSRCDRLISPPGKFGDRFPINLVGVEPHGDPALWANIGRHKEILWILSDLPPLLAQSRFTAERDLPVAVVIKEIVGKYLLANSERQMIFSRDVYNDFRELLTKADEPRPPLV